MIDPEILAFREREDRRVCDILRFSGARITSVYDLVNSRSLYPELVPALVAVLPTVAEPIIREGVVRALTVKEARGTAGPALIAEFPRPEASSTYRWAVGNALSVIATRSLFGSIAELLGNRTYGAARQMLPLALMRADRTNVEQVLLGHLDDTEILPHIVRELGNLRSASAVQTIRELLQHESKLVRTEAAKALKKMAPV